jgi:CSLREA domain-containing protein
MRLHSPFIFDRFVIIVALLVLLIGGAVQVTPACAAGIVVNSNADTRANDGKCTLREAIIAANTDARSGTRSGECVAGGTGDG